MTAARRGATIVGQFVARMSDTRHGCVCCPLAQQHNAPSCKRSAACWQCPLAREVHCIGGGRRLTLCQSCVANGRARSDMKCVRVPNGNTIAVFRHSLISYPTTDYCLALPFWRSFGNGAPCREQREETSARGAAMHVAEKRPSSYAVHHRSWRRHRATSCSYRVVSRARLHFDGDAARCGVEALHPRPRRRPDGVGGGDDSRARRCRPDGRSEGTLVGERVVRRHGAGGRVGAGRHIPQHARVRGPKRRRRGLRAPPAQPPSRDSDAATEESGERYHE